MSVINVTKMWSKSGGNFTSIKYVDYATKVSITEGYQVLAEIGDDASTIEQSLLLPRHGSQHPSGRLAYVSGIQVEPFGPIFWTAIVSYEGDMEEDAVELDWSDATTTEPIDREWSGRAIVTINNEPVEGLSTDISDQVLTIRRKVSFVDTYALGIYRRSTNSDTYLGWPPGTAHLVGYAVKSRLLNNVLVEKYDVTARIQFRIPYANTTPAQAWYKRWRHEGLWVNLGGVIQRAHDGQGQESPKPVLLKADGTRETNPDNAIFIHSQVYGSLPYGSLGLL